MKLTAKGKDVYPRAMNRGSSGAYPIHGMFPKPSILSINSVQQHAPPLFGL